MKAIQHTVMQLLGELKPKQQPNPGTILINGHEFSKDGEEIVVFKILADAKKIASLEIANQTGIPVRVVRRILLNFQQKKIAKNVRDSSNNYLWSLDGLHEMS
jgi:hypothetical protein